MYIAISYHIGEKNKNRLCCYFIGDNDNDDDDDDDDDKNSPR